VCVCVCKCVCVCVCNGLAAGGGRGDREKARGGRGSDAAEVEGQTLQKESRGEEIEEARGGRATGGQPT
jgi:hypothetical protein